MNNNGFEDCHPREIIHAHAVAAESGQRWSYIRAGVRRISNISSSAPSVNTCLVAGEFAESRYQNGNGHPLRKDRRTKSDESRGQAGSPERSVIAEHHPDGVIKTAGTDTRRTNAEAHLHRPPRQHPPHIYIFPYIFSLLKHLPHSSMPSS